MFRLELEYRQFSIYFFIIIFFFYFTGYIWTFLYLLVWVLAPLEELDPDEVESEEDLWPFIEFTYIETNWRKGEVNIEFELTKLKNYNNMEDIIFRETILFSTFMNKSENFLNSKIFILNDVNTYKSKFI
jgi:hypothetical protein